MIQNIILYYSKNNKHSSIVVRLFRISLCFVYILPSQIKNNRPVIVVFKQGFVVSASLCCFIKFGGCGG